MHYFIEFSLAFVFQTQAICISIIIFVYFAKNPTARLKREHHSWLVLLVMNFVQLMSDLPIALSFYYRGTVWPASDTFCAWWVWISFSSDTGALFLMVWIAIERHLLIFPSQTIFQRQSIKRMVHISALIICVIWAPIVYLILVVFSTPCTPQWNFTQLLCGPPCYTYTGFYGQYDFILNVCFPLFLNILINILLIIRVIRQKLSRQQRFRWRRHRKMIIQFWALSTLHLALWSPLVSVSLIQTTVDPTFMADQYTTLEYILYYMPLLLPLTCLLAMPSLVREIIGPLFTRRANVIAIADLQPVAGNGQVNTVIAAQ